VTQHAPLGAFQPATRGWFERTFDAPTEVQAAGWPAIARGEHALLLAPTGSGKTLAAFLACLDRLTAMRAGAEPGVRVLYVSPLKALAYDVERNLRVPLIGIKRSAEQLGVAVHDVTVAIRTGDTPPRERQQLVREPADILITTPESLYLLLSSRAREVLRTVETVIVDEIHAMAPTKRGAHLALSLERLAELTPRDPQRIGLSATQRPLDEIARFLGGARPVSIVDAGDKPRLDLAIEVPVEDLEKPPHLEQSTPAGSTQVPSIGEAGDRAGIWPHIHTRVLDLIRAHRSTIVFANSRRLCERMAQRLNELAGEELVRAHHGSIARPKRVEIEESLKSGALRGIVATSSLELGIDMGAVDLVIQIESPGAVSRGLQRVGRAGHGVGRRSEARLLPKYRGDLLESAVVARRMLDGEVEAISVPRNPLDVLAQQIVAWLSDRSLGVDALHALVKKAYPYAQLSRELYLGVLDMLAGRYPSDAFGELRPRIVWDRNKDEVTARKDAKMVAIVNAGTIPDRGLYGVHLGEGGPRVGELDEEMVHELRTGQTFLLGASTWRVAEITRDRVLVTPAPGEPGKMPFWRGEGPGRPIELGRALGAFIRELAARPEKEALAWLAKQYKLDEKAARNLHRYVRDQAEATGGSLPTDQSITVERFRDELGDWRVCILSPFGARVHAPWALALEATLSQRSGFEVQALWSDDGIVLRFASADGSDEAPELSALIPQPEDLETLLIDELGRSALFAGRFRENAARALLLPRRRPGQRTPLWAQRLRSANLLSVALQYPAFPIVLETYREVLNDVFDLPALRGLLEQIRARQVRVDEVETPSASPFSRSLAFEYVAAYLYEGDAPLAERKAQALTLDRNLLRELLGQEELRDLLEPAALDEVEANLQALAEDRRIRNADQTHDLLRRIGDLTADELRARAAEDPQPWIDELLARGRAVSLRIGGEPRYVAVEDVARYRDALGAQPPPGIAAAHLQPVEHPLESLAARWARTHGPFTVAELGRRFALLPAQVEPVLRNLVSQGRLLEGAFNPARTGTEYCDPDVLRLLRRATLARLRNQVAPVEASVLARFLPRWQGVGTKRGGLPRLREVIDQLQGLALPWSELEKVILPARVADFHPKLLDELGAMGELVWIGRGALGSDDGRVALYRREQVALLADPTESAELPTPLHQLILTHLETRGASFFAQLRALDAASDERVVEQTLWDLAWLGLITNDTFQPLRALGRARPKRGAYPLGGRWSAVSQLIGTRPEETARAHARANLLLERYGVVSREAVASEGTAGGFGAVAPVLRAMEEAGRIRRGHFVEGLAGAQFAHAGAVDRLRAARNDDEAPDVLTLSAIDPANVWGALLPWPEEPTDLPRPRRVAGARLILVEGVPVLYLESGGKKLRLFPGAEAHLEAALGELKLVAKARRHGQLRIAEVDGEPALRSKHLNRLEQLGFRIEPSGLVLD
jgi:ATP-dependent Lhr-like helicase